MTYIRPPQPSGTVTGNTTAELSEIVQFDPSGGTFTITAPLSPDRGDTFGIKNVTTDDTPITISGNGQNIEGVNTQTPAASVLVNGDGIGLLWQFDSVRWSLV